MARKSVENLADIQKAGNAVADQLGKPLPTAELPPQPSNILDEMFPSDSATPKSRKPKPKEAGILRACYKWLFKHPNVLLIERRTNMAVRMNDGRFIKTGQVGRADLWCVIEYPNLKGRWRQYHVEIECKRPNGRSSQNQKAFQSFCGRQGIKYIIVHSLRELKEIFRTKFGLT